MNKTFYIIFSILLIANLSSWARNKKNAPSYSSQNPIAMQKTYEFIKECQTYYLATTEGNQPRVRPFGTINIFEGKLYIQTGKKKRTAHQLAKNPKAELCCFNGKKWLRLSGTLVADERIEAKKSMLDAYPELRRMYDENDDNTIVYYFKDATAYLSSFAEPEEVTKF